MRISSCHRCWISLHLVVVGNLPLLYLLLEQCLPGEGQIYLFLDFVILLLAAFSALSLNIFTRDIALIDSAWPGYYAALR